MFIWELIAHRLRTEGWSVRHQVHPGEDGPLYAVHLHRPGACLVATGPTLSEAFAAASRRARDRTPALADAG